jgi:biopolymer transport protein ExbB/TolQ
MILAQIDVILAQIDVFGVLSTLMYLILALIALWGAFCVVMVWTRVAEKRFRNEVVQLEFLEALDEPLARGDFEAAGTILEGDKRAMSQLAMLAIVNRDIGFSKVRQMLVDRFQRDVLADLEYRLGWVNTVIKSAPMVGLLGTVMGMMGAFETLHTAKHVEPEQLAGDISFALITTACGLAIAIPLLLATASINVRIRKMEDLVAMGLTRFLESFRVALGAKPERSL